MLPIDRPAARDIGGAPRQRMRVMVACAVLSCTVMADAEIPRIAWEGVLQSAEQEFELRAAALSPDGVQVWVGIAARPRGAMGGVEQTVVMSMAGSRGQSRQTANIARDARLGDLVDRRALQGLAFGPDGRLMAALNRRASGATMATLDPADAQLLGVDRFAFGEATPEIARFVPLTGGRVLALGTLGTRPFLAQVGPAGSIVWQRVLAEENVNLDNGAATADGGAVVTGRIGADPEATAVWVAKISAKGDLQRSKSFPGWLGSAAQGADGGYLLVTSDRGREGAVRLVGLSDAFEQRWTRSMPAGQPVTPAYRVAAVAGGGFVVAGVKDRGLWLARLDQAGTQVWTEARPPKTPSLEAAFNVELVERQGSFAVAYTVFGVEGKEQRQFVRAIRFAP